VAVGFGGLGAVQHHGGYHGNAGVAGAYLIERTAADRDDGAGLLALERAGEIARAGG
jgi:hypothetical protein